MGNATFKYRFDTITKLIATFALCIHWFNPFVWVMYILFNRDLELACDESVVGHFGEQSKSAYALMLISMEAKKSGLSPLYNNFSRNAVEERITAIMNTKRTTPITFLAASLIVFVIINLFATSAIASADSIPNDTVVVSEPQTNAKDIAADKKSSMSITHESADILHYEDGAPYIHDILTNNTDRAIIETQYCMLAYNENGLPLKVGNGEANQVAYSLLCLKQVVFEDGTVWNNPDYEKWLQTYAGKETGVDELQHYYPHEYKIELE